MRIGVLEWASCGGMDGLAGLAESIRNEGWTMCRTALLSLTHAGHQAVALIDPQCAIETLVSDCRADLLQLVERSARESVRSQWRRLYASCDYTLVIAPECDQILWRLLTWCQRNKITTCNCSGTFVLRASDKLRTSKRLLAHNLPHPPTLSLLDAQRQWIADEWPQHSKTSCDGESTWVVKPRDGVGCEGTMRFAADELRSAGGFAAQPALAARGELSERDMKRWIVQPWLAGEACSRAAIVDRIGQLHWLPVTRQHLSVGKRVAYLGGSVAPQLACTPEVDALLTRAIAALGGHPCGWVGIDFLYDATNKQQPITSIEINPRLTTSFVGLTNAGAPELAGAIVAAVRGEPVELPLEWQTVRFTATGAIERT